MRKLFALILTMTFTIGLTGCSSSSASSKEISLSDPPVLTVKCNDQTINAESSTAEWNYATSGDEWKGFVSCGMHPLEGKDYAVVMNTTAKEAALEFAVAPDTVTVQCWSDAYWGNMEAVSETITVSDSVMPLKAGGNVYYITAAWNSYEKFNGSADYLLYITSK